MVSPSPRLLLPLFPQPCVFLMCYLRCVIGALAWHCAGRHVPMAEHGSQLLDGPTALDTHATVQDQIHQYSATVRTSPSEAV